MSKSEDGACTALAIPFSDDDTAPHEQSNNFKCSLERPGEASSLKCVTTDIDNQSASDGTIAAVRTMGAATGMLIRYSVGSGSRNGCGRRYRYKG